MSGIVTGARIFQILMSRRVQWVPAWKLANILAKDESYVRRTCHKLVANGLLLSEVRPQRGTKPVTVFRAKKWDGASQSWPDGNKS